MTQRETIAISLWASVVLAAAIALSVLLNAAPPPEGGASAFLNASAALTFISGAALVIERITEVFWTILGGIIGNFWPLRSVAKQVVAMEKNLENAITPFQEQLKADLDKIILDENWTADKLKTAGEEIEAFNKRFKEMKQYPPSNQRCQLLVAAVSQNVKFLHSKYGPLVPRLKEYKTVVDSAMGGLQDFLASFKDNPGRRLISIYLGCLMGLLVAGLYHLNAFAAALGKTDHVSLSVVFTGLLIGLGANPTHEVIRAIQEYKKSQKGGNALTPPEPGI